VNVIGWTSLSALHDPGYAKYQSPRGRASIDPKCFRADGRRYTPAARAAAYTRSASRGRRTTERDEQTSWITCAATHDLVASRNP
jgi:hypothetical protein